MRISRRKFLAGSAALMLARARPALAQVPTRPFTSGSLWNTLVPTGSSYSPLAWPTATGFNYSVAWDSFSPAVYAENLSDPLVAVVYSASWGYPAGTLNIHIPAGVTGAPGTDEELVVIGVDNQVYNFQGFVRTNDNNATADFLAWCDFTTGSGFGTASPFLGAGVMAIGGSELGGLLNNVDQTRVAASQPINHAIQLSVDVPLALPGFVPPAISGDGSSGTGIVTEGQKIAIPASTSMPGGLSTLGQAVFAAMKSYGVIIVDRAVGDSAVRAQANAWDAPTITALVPDMNVLVPLLESFSGGGGVRPPQMSLLGVGP